MEKFGQEGLGWRTNEARGTFGVGVWKEILKEADSLSQIFPLLFELAAHRNATVNEVWDPSFGQGSWNISFSRDFNDWEVDLVGNLLSMLRDYKISSEEDSVFWKVVRVLWEIVLVLFGIQWVFPETIKDMLFSWRGSFVGKKGKRFGFPSRCVFSGRGVLFTLRFSRVASVHLRHPRAGGPGLVGCFQFSDGYTEEWLRPGEEELVQRFDPSSPLDTIGFFIAKFNVGPKDA
ncbi:hypothetical protein CK203_032123 [Vitis vinifera]|uniref:Uncharacterized protein n=1 Tax=Vitis vinifera TaxID=29760 RepID=A0A438IPH6_VITVI|nr:hypothetical protein CK203_032123 [Vitis vinifera]